MAEMVMRSNEYIRMQNEYPEDDRDPEETDESRTSEWMESIDEDESENAANVPMEPMPEIDSNIIDGLGPHISDMDESEMSTPETDVGSTGSEEDASTEDDAIRIPPVSSSPQEAIETVPESEEIVRIGPDGGTTMDALDLIESIFLQRPPCDDAEYAEWYKRKMKREGLDVDFDDDGNTVVIEVGQ